MRLTSLLLATSLLCTSGAAMAKADPTPVVHGDAQVRVQEGGDFTAAADGTAIASGTVVRAPGNTAASIEVAEGVFVRLAPGSVVTARSFAWLPAEHPGAKAVRAFQLSLTSGELDLTANDPAGSVGITVLLSDGRSFALWRGAANVALAGDDAAIALYQGMAIAGSASKWKPLTAGKGMVLTAKGDTVARAIPGTSDWADSASKTPAFALVRGNTGGVVGAAWSEAAGAAKYRVEMARDATMDGPLTVRTYDTPSLQTDPLAPGAYAIRVRALGPEGIVGPPSSPKVLRVARLSLPPGANVASDGAVVLSATSALHFDDPTGIEVATVVNHAAPDEALFWQPAGADLSLGSADRREVRIRHPATHVETSVLLVRRALRARVTFTPRPARWPQDAIDIRVKLEDPSGYVDPAREAIHVDTRIDIDRVALQWQHAGDTWVARLPPQTSGGPWVVRVEVDDASGAPIGASILDVDGPASQPGFQQASFRH